MNPAPSTNEKACGACYWWTGDDSSQYGKCRVAVPDQIRRELPVWMNYADNEMERTEGTGCPHFTLRVR